LRVHGGMKHLTKLKRTLTAEIVSAHAGNNSLRPCEPPGLIA